MRVDDQLKTELRRRAEALPVREDPYALVSRRIAVSGRRRTAAAVACVVMLLVAGVLGAPELIRLAGRDDRLLNQPADPEGSAGSPMTWPVRGSLAGDQTYIRRAQAWLSKRTAVTERVRNAKVNVLYAGDVGGKRLVVGAYELSGEVHVVSLAGPRGTGEELNELPVSWSGRLTAFDHIYAVALPGDPDRRARGTTVVVLADATVSGLAYSRAPDIDPDGTITRTWTPLVDGDDEPGVVTMTFGDVFAVGALRILGERPSGPVVYQPADHSGESDEMPDTRLRQLAEHASGEQFVEELAPALRVLESADLGRGAITSVRISWRFERDGEWIGLVLGLADGGVVEAVLTPSGSMPVSTSSDGTVLESALYAVRTVPSGRAGQEPFFWRSSDWRDDGVEDCRVFGYVPDAGLGVATADLVIDGRPTGRTSTNGRPAVLDFCDARPGVKAGSIDDATVRLYDQDGRQVWTGGLAASFSRSPRAVGDP